MEYFRCNLFNGLIKNNSRSLFGGNFNMFML